MWSVPEVSPQILPGGSPSEQRVMVSRYPLIERADGIEQFRGDHLAIVQRQQQSG
jgi:hypothetical protein